ncbi:PRMT5-domain-containing protein [Mycena kentingensis (nom. inval.)]|nr:PRMT5-domain-containing protein [Mycena kentingensis (nom. inval.)]
MKFPVSAAALVSLIPLIRALTINTPSASALTACQPISLTWQDGTAPYFPSIIPGGNPAGTALKTFDTTSDTSLTWTVDIAPGTSITVALKDSTGTIAYSDAVTIGGSDTSCLSGSGSAAAGAASTGAATNAANGASASGGVAATSGAASGAASAGSATTASSAVARASSGTGSASASAGRSSDTGAALGSTVVNYGLSGLLTLFGIVLL